jgi:hypothetical protein
MSSLHILLGRIGDLLLLSCLVGLIYRGRHRLCWSFTVYLVTVLIPQFLILTWPDRFYTWTFWIIKESLADLVKFAVALELTSVVFQAFPVARTLARRLMLVVLVATFIAVVMQTATAIVYRQPRALSGTIWLFTVIAVVAVWHRIPLHPFHRALILGFGTYVAMSTITVSLAEKIDWPTWRSVFGTFKTLLYAATLVFWTRAAWRSEVVPDVSPAILRRLQPWRGTS